MNLPGLRLPVLPNEKRTYQSDWSNPTLAQPEMPAGGNQALRLECVTDLDLDCPEAVAAAAEVLRDTNTCSFGRRGRDASHYLFDAPGAESDGFKDVDGSMLLEIRHGFTHYTVIPPSRVARKDAPSIIDELVYVSTADPMRVSVENVRMVACVIATIALLTRHWKKSGRHNGLLALAGYLARVNVSQELATVILKEITRHGEGDPWVKECEQIASDTYAKHAAGAKTTGGGPQGLAPWLGKEVVARLNEWFKVEDPKTAPRELTLVAADTIEMKPVKWLWTDRVPLGSFGLTAGREGLGKSMQAYTMAADLTRGRMVGVYQGQPRSVIICATEDSWAHTITPRLRAAGADLSKIFRVDVITKGANVELLLPSDVEALTALMVKQGDVALLLLDPLIARLASKLDTHKDAEVRQALEPLSKMADEVGVVILGIIHVNKGTSRDPLNMVMGSRAFAAVARFVLFVAADPDDEDRRLLGQVKNNLGRSDLPTLSFTIIDQHVTTTAEGDEIRTGMLVWGADDERSIRDVIGEAASKKETPRGNALTWLKGYLDSLTGPVMREEVMAAGTDAGHSTTTLKRAAEELAVVSTPAGRKTMWSLAAQQRLPVPAPFPSKEGQ